MENEFQKWLISKDYYRDQNSKVWKKDGKIVCGKELLEKLNDFNRLQQTINE